MTLDEWADTRKIIADLAEDDVWKTLDVQGPGVVYDGGYISGPVDGVYNLLIERSEWSSTSLERLEGILYEIWIKHEVLGVFNS